MSFHFPNPFEKAHQPVNEAADLTSFAQPVVQYLQEKYSNPSLTAEESEGEVWINISGMNDDGSIALMAELQEKFSNEAGYQISIGAREGEEYVVVTRYE